MVWFSSLQTMPLFLFSTPAKFSTQTLFALFVVIVAVLANIQTKSQYLAMNKVLTRCKQFYIVLPLHTTAGYGPPNKYQNPKGVTSEPLTARRYQ
mgnify:CR=1